MILGFGLFFHGVSSAHAQAIDNYLFLKENRARCGFTASNSVDWPMDLPGLIADTLPLEDDDEQFYTLPFAFPFFDKEFTQIVIGNNGGIYLVESITGTPANIFAGNGPLPNTESTYGIFPFWDDIDDETGAVVVTLAVVNGSFRDGTAVVDIQWNRRPHFNNTGESTFTLHLWQDGAIGFSYEDIDFGSPSFDNGASATVGIQGVVNGRQVVKQVSFNTALDHSSSCFIPDDSSILDLLPAIISGATKNK